MSVGSTVILLVLAVGLQSLFNGESIGCAHAKPSASLTVEDVASSPGYYDSLFKKIGFMLKANSSGAKPLGDQNTVQRIDSYGFLNTGSIIENLNDVHNGKHPNDSGPGAFTLGTHNTIQSLHSNMTINTGSWVTYSRNT